MNPGDKEFECYNIVYDKKYGYMDENQYYTKEQEQAIKEAKEYVEKGVPRTYAVVTETELDNDADVEDACVTNEAYLVSDIVFSVAKFEDKIVEDFIEKE